MTNTAISTQTQEKDLAEMIFYMVGIVKKTPIPESWESLPPYRQNLFATLAKKALELKEMT